MRLSCTGLIMVLLVAGSTGAPAQLPLARLNWIFPTGATAGSTVELRVAGDDLDEPAGLLFSDPRLTAAPVPGSLDRYRVEVPGDVGEGMIEVRCLGRFGVSNPRPFLVGSRPERTVASPNTAPTQAVDLPWETVINGRIQPNSDGWFRFEADKGRRVLIQVETAAIDSRLVPELFVVDAGGRELAVSRRRSLLDFTAPDSGHFFLRIHDQTYRGGDDYPFRLVLTAGTHLDFALPSSLRAGATNRLTLFGRNLPGGNPSALKGPDGVALEQLSMEFVAPADSSPLSQLEPLLREPAAVSLLATTCRWQLTVGEGGSNPLFFALTTNRVTGSPFSEITTVDPPCDYSGIFPVPGHASGVSFPANKGEVYWLEVLSERLGFSSNPHVVVQRLPTTPNGSVDPAPEVVLELADQEQNLGDREFNTRSRDAAARFEAPESGVYRAIVRDRFNLGEGRPRYPYLLRIRRESPDFRLVALPMPPPRSGDDRKIPVLPLSVRRGETIALKVIAFRADGFDGDITLGAADLPPGVSVIEGKIASGQNTGTLLFSAAGDAEGFGPVRITGTALLGTHSVTRECRLASVVRSVPDFNNESSATRINQEFQLSVITAEWAPVSVEIDGESILELAEGAPLAVPLRITRRGEFAGAFKLKPAGHPALEKAGEVAVAENATNAVAKIDPAASKLPVGTHTIWFQGSVGGKYRNNPGAIEIAEAELRAAEQAVAAASDADRPGADERRKTAEAAKKNAEDRAKPRDVTVVLYSQALRIKVIPSSIKEENR